MAWWLQGLVSLGCALPGGCHRDSPSQVLVTLYRGGIHGECLDLKGFAGGGRDLIRYKLTGT